MQPRNIARVLHLAWWAVAAIFQPEDALSPPLQAAVVAGLTQHYVAALMSKRGALGSTYLRLWVDCTARAACEVLRSAFAGSAAAGELGEELEGKLRRQLRLWSTGERLLVVGDAVRVSCSTRVVCVGCVCVGKSHAHGGRGLQGFETACAAATIASVC